MPIGYVPLSKPFADQVANCQCVSSRPNGSIFSHATQETGKWAA